ncbi:MAG: hypothetical protein WBX03_04820 [Terriglobales bacterium]|jgi:uncharacterized protein with PIN domain
MQVTCLRCNGSLEKYSVTSMTFLPYGAESSHAMLECPSCGHVEFVARNSSMLSSLEIVEHYAGDGD